MSDDIKRESAKLLATAANEFIKIVSSASYEMWNRKDFRMYLDFDTLTQVEQDRIFNELQVSFLGLILLNFDHAIKIAKEDKRPMLSAFQKDLIPAYLHMYSDLQIEKKFVDQWEQLIHLRVEEYRRDFEIAIGEAKNVPVLKNEKALQPVWARIETIAIDCLTHIRKGQFEKDDPLWELLHKWFITLDTQISPLAQ